MSVVNMGNINVLTFLLIQQAVRSPC